MAVSSSVPRVGRGGRSLQSRAGERVRFRKRARHRCHRRYDRRRPSRQSRLPAKRHERDRGKRILGDVKRAVTGKVSQEQHFAKSTINRVHGGWLKITPTESLAPGEYAVVEMLGKEGMNLYVWDFGVNPNAPPNANPWKPDTKAAKPLGSGP